MLEQIFWQDLRPHGGSTLEQSTSEGLHPMERTHAEAVLEELQPVGKPMLQQSVNCLPWVGPHAEAGEKSAEEGAAERTCDEPTATPIPGPPAPLSGEEVQNFGVKFIPGRREEWGGRCFLRFGLSLSYSHLIGDKFPQLQSILPVTVIGE